MKMNYPYGKIYKIVSDTAGLCYIGSTTQRYLCSRLSYHKYNASSKKCTSHLVIEYPDARIELMENFPVESITDLRIREGQLTKENVCVNKNIAGRTSKEYYKDNKEHLNEMTLRYREKHLEEYREYQREYRALNDNIEKVKQWREKNKERYLDYQKNYRLKKKEAMNIQNED